MPTPFSRKIFNIRDFYLILHLSRGIHYAAITREPNM